MLAIDGQAMVDPRATRRGTGRFLVRTLQDFYRNADSIPHRPTIIFQLTELVTEETIRASLHRVGATADTNVVALPRVGKGPSVAMSYNARRELEQMKVEQIQNLGVTNLWLPTLFTGWMDSSVASIETSTGIKTLLTHLDFSAIQWLDELPLSIMNWYWDRIAYTGRAHKIHSISHAALTEANTLLPEMPEHFVQWLGVDDFRHELDGSSKKKARGETIFVMTAPDVHKNLSVVIEAWTTLRDEGKAVRLIVGGAKGTKAFWTSRMDRKGFRGVKFVEDLSDTDRNFFYKNAKAVICPSKNEGFGLTLAEALVSNQQVFFSNIPAHLELAGTEVNSFDPDCAEQLLDLMRMSLSSQANLPTPPTFYSTRFTWEGAGVRIISELADL